MYLPHTLGLTEAPVTHCPSNDRLTNREVRPGLKHWQADTGSTLIWFKRLCELRNRRDPSPGRGGPAGAATDKAYPRELSAVAGVYREGTSGILQRLRGGKGRLDVEDSRHSTGS